MQRGGHSGGRPFLGLITGHVGSVYGEKGVFRSPAQRMEQERRLCSCISRRRSPNGGKPLAVRGDVRQTAEMLLHFAETFAKWQKASCTSRRRSPNGRKALAIRGDVRQTAESLCSSRSVSPNGRKPLVFRGDVRQMAEVLLHFAERFAKWQKASCSSRRRSPNDRKALAVRGDVRQMAHFPPQIQSDTLLTR